MGNYSRGILTLLTLLFFSIHSDAQNYIHTDGTKILSGCGEEIVFRGVNEMFVWAGNNNTGTTLLPQIAKTGANSVRLVWKASEGTVGNLDKLIQNTLDNNMIPIPELHDATGDFSQFQSLVNWWVRPDVIQMIDKYEDWIIVNIGNEVGSGSESDAQYATYYKNAITTMREAGIEVAFMIDAGGWGNQEKYVVNTCVELMQHDASERQRLGMASGANLIFSVHTYWPGTNQITRLNTLISNMKSRNAPLCFGEGPQKPASPSSCSQVFPYKDMIRRCEEEGLGWITWSWGAVPNGDCDNGSGSSEFNLTTNGTFGNWSTTFAEELCVTDVNSIQNTSIIPASLTGGCNVEDCAGIIGGSAKIDFCGQCSGGTTGIEVCSQAPYNDTPQQIPGIVEVEFYDLGGEGEAYHDDDGINEGGDLRTGEAVDVEFAGNGTSDYNIGWIEPTEWVEFTVEVLTSGEYAITYMVASNAGAGQWHLEQNNSQLGEQMSASTTGGWQVYGDVETTVNINLEAGEQIIRLVFDEAGFNISKMTFDLITITGIASDDYQNVTMYPNPTTNQLNIVTNDQLIQITIYNSLGEKIITRKGENASKLLLDTSDLENGIYTAEIITKKQTVLKKIVKNN